MNLLDTRIQTAGVLRCCLVAVAEEYEGKPVGIGAKSKCRHCGETFTLVAREPHPMWVPDWQLTEKP